MRARVQAQAVICQDDDHRVFAPGELTWEGGTITSVGPPGSDPTPVDRTLCEPEGVVMPGFFNGHNHAAMSLMRGLADDADLFTWLHRHIFPAESRLSADDVYIGTLLAAAEMIHTGTVAFADMYFFVDAIARAVADSGLRGYLARGLVEADDPGGEKIAETVAWAKAWASRADGRVVGMLGPHAPYTCGPAYLKRVAEAARANGIGVHIHVAETRREVKDMQAQYGRSPLAMLAEAGILSVPVILAHAIYLDDADLSLLDNVRGGAVTCPVSNAKLGSGVMDVRRLTARGVTVGLGTDGAASTNNLDMFLEMKMLAWMQKLKAEDATAFTADEALWAATRAGADLVGAPGGRLAAGRAADFIVVRTQKPHWAPTLNLVSNLVYSAVGGDVAYSVINGTLVLDDGKITTFDEKSVLEEARLRARRILEG